MIPIENVTALEVLDSRGHPTIQVTVETDRETGSFRVPSGASTGSHEVIEKRDETASRYRGLGVREAVRIVEDELGPEVVGRPVTEQETIDHALVEYDGTADLSSCGGNTILGVSGAVAHAAANSLNKHLFEYLSHGTPELPIPMVNILSGGMHARGGIDIQDFLVVPRGRQCYERAIEDIWQVRQAVRDRIIASNEKALVADEGGFSPQFGSISGAFELLCLGIEDAGFEPIRQDIGIAVDVAATHFFDAATDQYHFDSLGITLGRDEMVNLITGWARDYPLLAVEDPLSEMDWEGWSLLRDRLDQTIQLIGDDILVTDIDRLHRAVRQDAANGILIKPNQVGTISQTIAVIREAQKYDIQPIISARSGETCDATIVDIAVAMEAGLIKIGSLSRSERTAKYNRLFEIASIGDFAYASGPWPSGFE